MKPSQLDESLLTAYLDDELTDAERKLVEDQLTTNEHWKQLLKELRSVRQLVRSLPTPILSRSLSAGPWNETCGLNQKIESTIVQQEASHRSRSNFKMFVLAASLILCAVGAFAWIRFRDERSQLAVLDKEADFDRVSASAARPSESLSLSDAPSSSADSEAVLKEKSVVKEMPDETRDDLSRLTISPTDKLRIDSRREDSEKQQTTPMQRAAKPKAAAPAPTSETYSFNSSGGTKIYVAPKVEPSLSPTPIQTFYATPIKATAKNLPNSASENGATTMQLGNSLEFQRENVFWKQSGQSQPQELQLMRSELPRITQRLNELGFEIHPAEVLVESQPELSKSEIAATSVNDASAAKAEASAYDESNRRPPLLTGAIVEPTDWIRIVFEGR